MSELILKEDALNCFHDWIDKYGYEHTADEDAAYQRIAKLPAVQPDHVADVSKKVELGDCISRQMAIKEVSEHGTIWMSYTDDMSACEIAMEAISNAKDMTIRIIKGLPAVQPEPHWIPCSERLPEEGSYLVWMPFAPPEKRIAVADYCDGYWNIKTPISAWQPLPEPYGGGEKE